MHRVSAIREADDLTRPQGGRIYPCWSGSCWSSQSFRISREGGSRTGLANQSTMKLHPSTTSTHRLSAAPPLPPLKVVSEASGNREHPPPLHGLFAVQP